MTFSFSFPSSAPMPTSSSSAASSSSHSASSISVTSDALSAPYASCTSLAFCSMFGEVAIKCVVDDDISLVRLNLDTDLSYSGLQRYTSRLSFFVIARTRGMEPTNRAPSSSHTTHTQSDRAGVRATNARALL
jgi:hypothetical protein